MQNKKVKLMLGLLIFVLSIVIFCIWQNNDIVISRYVYENNKIGAKLDGFKIAQISDLHNKEFGSNSKRLLDKLRKEKPNIIVVTGDIVDRNRTNIDIALEFVKGALEIAPVFYISGNHEYSISGGEWNKLMQSMSDCGVIFMDNKVIDSYKGEEIGFYLIGLGDKNLTDGTLQTLTSNLNSDKLKILLAHEPQNLKLYSQTKVDLIFAGHAHGGQFRLPFVGGLIAPNQGFFPKYTAGTYTEAQSTMVVSRGLGNSVIPVRIFNRPEIVIVTLKKV
ncbi:MAG: metallophosphoesterase [Mobilitalea sp.]